MTPKQVALTQIGNAWWCDEHQGLHQGLLISFTPDHRRHLHALFFNHAPVANFYFDFEVSDRLPVLQEAEDVESKPLTQEMGHIAELYEGEVDI